MSQTPRMHAPKVAGRLFWGLSVQAPWPEEPTTGRPLAPEHRHLTLLFLGLCSWGNVQSVLTTFPPPPFVLGPSGILDSPLFLPLSHPHVVALHAQCREELPLMHYHNTLTTWAQLHALLSHPPKAFLPHVTLARSPFDPKPWEAYPLPLPFYTTALHLYESQGNLKYIPLKTWPLIPCIEEREHTADIAFSVRGTTWEHLFYSGLLALAFSCPAVLHYIPNTSTIHSLEEVIRALNHCILRLDADIGAPFKGVSFHGKWVQKEAYMQWEMIVDV